jgi:hypothetical protein
MDIAQRIQCRSNFRQSAASSRYQASLVHVSSKAQSLDDWQVVPNLSTLIVGRSSVMKVSLKGPSITTLPRSLHNLRRAHDKFSAQEENFGANAVKSYANTLKYLQGQLRRDVKIYSADSAYVGGTHYPLFPR